MKLFNAIGDARIIPLFYEKTGIKLNVLVSYHYLQGQEHPLVKEYRKMYNLLYLDSGAFSANTGKSKIDVHEYLQYLNLNGKPFDVTFNLDDNFSDPEHNWQNQVYLEKHLSKGIEKPVPVLHDAQDPFAEFERYYADYPYVAIGSNRNVAKNFFKKVKGKYPRLKVHLFGNLSGEMLLKYRPYSADSAFFVHTSKFGVIYYWDPQEKKEYPIDLGEREKNVEVRVEGWRRIYKTKKKKQGNVPHFSKFKYRGKLEKFLRHTFGYEYHHLLSSWEARYVVNLYFIDQFQNFVNSLPPERS